MKTQKTSEMFKENIRYTLQYNFNFEKLEHPSKTFKKKKIYDKKRIIILMKKLWLLSKIKRLYFYLIKILMIICQKIIKNQGQ